MSQTPSFLYPNNRSLVAADVLDLGGLALQTAQVIELRTAHLTTADDLDMINAGRMQRERALYADAVADAANREGFAAGAVAAGDYSAFKRLKTFAVTFNNLYEHAQGVANVEVGPIGTELRLFDGLDDFAHFECSSFPHRRSCPAASARSVLPAEDRPFHTKRIIPHLVPFAQGEITRFFYLFVYPRQT